MFPTIQSQHTPLKLLSFLSLSLSPHTYITWLCVSPKRNKWVWFSPVSVSLSSLHSECPDSARTSLQEPSGTVLKSNLIIIIMEEKKKARNRNQAKSNNYCRRPSSMSNMLRKTGKSLKDHHLLKSSADEGRSWLLSTLLHHAHKPYQYREDMRLPEVEKKLQH